WSRRRRCSPTWRCATRCAPPGSTTERWPTTWPPCCSSSAITTGTSASAAATTRLTTIWSTWWRTSWGSTTPGNGPSCCARISATTASGSRGCFRTTSPLDDPAKGGPICPTTTSSVDRAFGSPRSTGSPSTSASPPFTAPPRPFEHELALHDARNGAELFPDHALPVLILARDHERCLVRLALRHHLRLAAGPSIEVEPDAHRIADPDFRLTVHDEGDRTVCPLEGGGTIRVARVDRHTVGAHPLGRREGDAHAIASAKPRNSASSTSSSGCHWTASTRGAPGSFHSAPSMTPSSAQAV